MLFSRQTVEMNRVRLIKYQEHIATFKGTHNRSKSKALIALLSQKRMGKTEGVTVSELHSLTGVSYSYLKWRLAYWCRWRYVVKHTGNGRPRYTIGDRGRRFVLKRIPAECLKAYVQEINEYRSNQP